MKRVPGNAGAKRVAAAPRTRRSTRRARRPAAPRSCARGSVPSSRARRRRCAVVVQSPWRGESSMCPLSWTPRTGRRRRSPRSSAARRPHWRRRCARSARGARGIAGVQAHQGGLARAGDRAAGRRAAAANPCGEPEVERVIARRCTGGSRRCARAAPTSACGGASAAVRPTPRAPATRSHPLAHVDDALAFLRTVPFQEMQGRGWHLQPNHFYWPLNDVQFLRAHPELWHDRGLPAGIDWDLDGQVAFARELATLRRAGRRRRARRRRRHEQRITLDQRLVQRRRRVRLLRRRAHAAAAPRGRGRRRLVDDLPRPRAGPQRAPRRRHADRARARPRAC